MASYLANLEHLLPFYVSHQGRENRFDLLYTIEALQVQKVRNTSTSFWWKNKYKPSCVLIACLTNFIVSYVGGLLSGRKAVYLYSEWILSEILSLYGLYIFLPPPSLFFPFPCTLSLPHASTLAFLQTYLSTFMFMEPSSHFSPSLTWSFSSSLFVSPI